MSAYRTPASSHVYQPSTEGNWWNKQVCEIVFEQTWEYQLEKIMTGLVWEKHRLVCRDPDCQWNPRDQYSGCDGTPSR